MSQDWSFFDLKRTFGSVMSERAYNIAKGYRYGFNGKETDSESSTQDYGMRIYNPALGRFLSVDPISNDYPELTTYQFASNHPINSVDIDGFEADAKFDGIERQDRLAAERKYPGDSNSQNEFIRERRNARGFGALAGAAIVATAMGGSYMLGILSAAEGTAVTAGSSVAIWLSNPVNQMVVIEATSFAVNLFYDGPDDVFPTNGSGGEVGKILNKAVVKVLKYNDQQLGYLAREVYNKILKNIPEATKDLKTWKEKAKKAFEIRDKAKDFTRELSGEANKVAAEEFSKGKYGKAKPSFEELFEKYRKESKTDDEAYEKIFKKSMESNKEINEKVKK